MASIPWRRWLSDYGMLGVLGLLCIGFSMATFSKQNLTGARAARNVASQIPSQGCVIIVASSSADDLAFAQELHRELNSNGVTIVDDVRGEPRDARRALERVVFAGQRIDRIICTPAAAQWRLIADLDADFPTLAEAAVIVPRSYWWPNFLKRENVLNIANQIAVIAIIAIGMTMVIVSGGIDLSVGSLIALSAVVSTLLIRNVAGGRDASTPGMILACLAGVVVCGLVGCLTGILVTSFRVPSFIVTLAMMLVASGVALRLTDGESVYEIPDRFVWIGRSADLAGVPNAVVLMLILYVAAHVLMSRTTLGRYLYAVGGNSEAARMAGLSVRSVRMFAYVASSLLAGIGGVIMASQLKSGSPNYGNGYELSVIAAVVVGGTSLSGGQGSMPGTLIGALIIAVIQNGMNLMNVNPFTQKIALGLIILSAVLLDQQKHRLWISSRS